MPEFKPENPGRRHEAEDVARKFFDLMGSVIKKYGSLETAAAAVDQDSDVAAAVVKRWFQTGVGPQSPVLSRKIIGSLEHLAAAEQRRVGEVTKKLVPPMAPKPQPPAEAGPAPKPAGPEQSEEKT